MTPAFYILKRLCVILLCITLLIIRAKGDCGIPEKPNYAESNLDQNSFPVGSTVTYTCRPGFVRVPGTSSKITCLDGNTWSETFEFCKRKSCGHPGDILNGDFQAEDFLFGSRVTYHCNVGYILSNKRNYRDCQADGQWSNIVPQCDAVICTPPEKPADGSYNPQKDEYSHSDSVTFTCNKGLEIAGNSSVYCTTDGTWSSNSPICTAVECPNPDVPNSRRLSGFVGPYTLNHGVTFECTKGFAMHGSSSIVCNIKSQWEPEVPQCRVITVKSCGDSGEIENAEKSTTDNRIGTRVTYTCKEGYEMQGAIRHKECQADGRWSDVDIVCTVRVLAAECSAPPIFESAEKTSAKLTRYPNNTVVEYTCKKGFELKPNKVNIITCLGNRWSSIEEPCHSQKNNVPMIVGITIPLVVLCCVCVFIFYKKKQKQSRKLVSNTPDVHYAPCDA